jgi:hypothetical protein
MGGYQAKEEGWAEKGLVVLVASGEHSSSGYQKPSHKRWTMSDE